MGAPVKIEDLAQNLILFTGLRPGEKLYEELRLLEEGAVATRQEKIRVFAGRVIVPAEVEGVKAKMRAAEA